MGNYQNTRHHKGPREMVTGGEWIYGRNPVEEGSSDFVVAGDTWAEFSLSG